MADVLLCLYASSLKKRKIEEDLRSQYDIDNLPRRLVEALTTVVENAGEYERITQEYNDEQLERAAKLILPVRPTKLGHSDISCITDVSTFPSLCGFNFTDMNRLFHSLKRILRLCFPRSVDEAIPGNPQIYCTRRMKLFLFLFRCKLGASFEQMMGIFGWSDSSLQEWFVKIAFNLAIAMKRYNTGFIKFKGIDWQRRAIINWSLARTEDGSFQSYQDRIEAQNTYSRSKGREETIDRNCLGSFGAADGTISVSPRISPAVLASQGEDPNSDRMYCEYKKTHGHKLLAFISHAKGPRGKKYILKLKSAVGSCGDSSCYSSMIGELRSEVLDGTFFF
jgi:hypothetical protein